MGGSKTTTIASASRGLIQVRFCKVREGAALALAAASRGLRRAQRATLNSLKWQAEVLPLYTIRFLCFPLPWLIPCYFLKLLNRL